MLLQPQTEMRKFPKVPPMCVGVSASTLPRCGPPFDSKPNRQPRPVCGQVVLIERVLKYLYKWNVGFPNLVGITISIWGSIPRSST